MSAVNSNSAHNSERQPPAERTVQRAMAKLRNNSKATKFNIGDQRFQIDGPTNTNRADRPMVLALQIDKSEAWVEISNEFIFDICQEQNPDIPLADVPDAYRGMFLEVILTPLIDHLESILSSKITIDHIYDTRSNVAAAKIFDTAVQPDYRIIGFLITSRAGQTYPLGLKIGNDRIKLLDRLLRYSQNPNSLLGSTVDRQSTVQILYATVAVSKPSFDDLEVGDHLVTSKSPGNASEVVLFVARNAKAAGTLHDNSLRLDSDLQENMEALDSSTTQDQNMVSLDLMFGTPDISVVEAMQKTQGSLITMATNTSPITICNGDQVVGLGHIVEVDNHVAICIDEIV